MPQLRAGEWLYDQGEVLASNKPGEVKAEDRVGHRPLSTYSLPKWAYHPDKLDRKVIVEKNEYFGSAADGARNFENWNIAHVAAYHDDLKLLSLATLEQCKEPNKYGMTPAHMCGLGQHAYGPSLNVLYELIQMGVCDPEAANHAEQTPWHIAQRMHKPANLKMYEKVLLKGHKPKEYDALKEFQLKNRAVTKKSADETMKVNGASGGTMIVFPGQGSQYVGMMKSLREIPKVKAMLKTAQDILGYDLLDLMLNGPEEKLAQTKYCQPAMYVAGLAAFEQLRVDEPSKASSYTALAGLSLGEYTALTIAGVFDFETGLKIVKERGEAMENETTRPGAPKQGMLSIAGLDQDVVEKLCKEVSAGGDVCQIANFLFPKGFSCAGTEAALIQLEKKAMDAQALQAKMLKTSGGFHTPLMAGAKEHLLEHLKAAEAKMQPPQCTVYMNVNAKPIPAGSSVKDIIDMLGNQLVSPVMWEQTVKQAFKDGCKDFVECGPSKQLKAMMKRIEPKAAEKMINVVA
jgi:[acyl-carrier-protein] S-malonyltransferase